MNCPTCKSELLAIKQAADSPHDYQIICSKDGTHIKWSNFKEVQEYGFEVIEYKNSKRLF
jgi:C4-type Zn-finger protein